MNSGNSKRDGWRSELPSAGLGIRVIETMKDEKTKDAAWQGKCSGTVYVPKFFLEWNHNVEICFVECVIVTSF